MPYHSWRITHAKHHASTAHMTQDQVFVPKTRKQMGLPALNPEKENLEGTSVSEAVAGELWEALGDSPLGATVGFASYLVRVRWARRDALADRLRSCIARWMAAVPYQQRIWSEALPERHQS